MFLCSIAANMANLFGIYKKSFNI